MIGKWTINLDRCLLWSFYSWRTSDCEDDSDYEGLILFVRMEKRRSRQNYEDQISIDREKMEFLLIVRELNLKIAKKWFRLA